MTVSKKNIGKKMKTQKGKRSSKRRTQKGGWPWSSAPSDPNVPKKPGFFESLFGSSKKSVKVEEKPQPITENDVAEEKVEEKPQPKTENGVAEAKVEEKTQKGGKSRHKKHKK